ncbi:MAG: ATP-binding cassette domain-containing protein [Planctomycetes bacterium]|nr:ATP-binding cassette domain-containing protein [Planctomycetota bacterium]
MEGQSSVLLSAEQIRGTVGAFSVGPIDLQLSVGERLGVVGPSGSGKTTLLRLLSLFVLPENGRLIANSFVFDFRDRKPSEGEICTYRRVVSIVSQQTHLWPHFTILENVEFGIKHVTDLSKRGRREKAMSLLEVLEIPHIAARKPWQVSGGEARRAAVARSLAVEPKVMLLDEVETGLDRDNAIRQMNLITRVCNRAGASIVIVTHNPWLLQSFTDRIIELRNGTIFTRSSTADFFSERHDMHDNLLNTI